MCALTHLSLFSGIGGNDLAAEAAGFRTVGLSEVEPFCCRVLSHHWPEVKNYGDIRCITGRGLQQDGIDNITLLTGGVPCQPSSLAGARAGTSDDRWLWGEFTRLIGETRPRWVIGENPRGILSVNAGAGFSFILEELARLGYRAGWCCYEAADVGAPQHRARVFIIGFDAAMADTNSGRRDGRKDTQTHVLHGTDAGWQQGIGLPESGGQAVLARAVPQHMHPRTGSTRGITQPSLGGGAHGIPRWTPEHSWPARPGERQHNWEEERLAKDIPERVAKLKALGNALVPAQMYPLLCEIARIEYADVPLPRNAYLASLG